MTAPAANAAIAAAVSEAMPSAPAEQQLELMPPTDHEPGSPRAMAIAELVRRDRAGRPPGAQNVKTRDAVDFIRKVLGDPLIERARWAGHTPASLALALGCTKLEAFDRLDRMRADLARFMYAPLAPVDAQGNPVVPFFAMQIGGAGPVAPGVSSAPWVYDGGPGIEESQQNQGVSAVPDGVSHAPVSHEDTK
jgi:hypothetical protein